MNKSKFTDWGLQVKMTLLRKGKTQVWLEKEVAKHTGLYIDGAYLNRILTGQRNAPKIISAINEILEIKGE